MRARLTALPLFVRVFATNAALLVLVLLALALAPVTVSVPPTTTQVLVLLVGLLGALILNALLLRPAFRPLHDLVATMNRHDPLAPGLRVRVYGGPKIVALARAFNELLDRLEAERRESARGQLLAQEGERRRIARELHDEVGQTLTGVILQVEGLAPTIPESLRDQLGDLREIARHGIEEVRRIAAQLRPVILEDLGLQPALAALATAFRDQAGIPVERRLDLEQQLSEEQELVIYRIAQEAFANVAHHARATFVELRLERIGREVILSVRDDGQGLPTGVFPSSHGIRGMRERALLIGAALTISGPPDGGVEVRLTVPLDVAGPVPV
jgi:two-component system, NarL family, sensor histidine kinase UhpB